MQPIIAELEKKLPLGNESRRLFHGRGRCFVGYEDLTIDWYAPVVLLILYQPRDPEWLQQLCEYVTGRVANCEALLLQERFLPDAPSRLLWGRLPEPVLAVEAGLRYRLRLAKAQNPGFFPDMAVGRSLVRRIAAGKRILNLFAYSCSFSVAAVAGGATQVTNLDMNRGALELGRNNHRENVQDLRRVGFLPLELFRSFGRLRKLGPFDLVICDPPAYQGQSFKAERDWPKLLRKLPQLLTPQGEIIACLNAPHLPPSYLATLFSETLPQARLLNQLGPGPDFPEATETMGVSLCHYQLRAAGTQTPRD